MTLGAPVAPSDSDHPRVTIYVPTYRNELIFGRCLDSYRMQTYENLSIRIFDDSLADGYSQIADLVSDCRDNRIHYVANSPRLGAPGNDIRILSEIAPDELVLVVPADMGLRADAVAFMVDALIQNRASVIRPGTATHEYATLESDGDYDFSTPIRTDRPESVTAQQVVSSASLIEKYFGPQNARGEYFDFSFWGSLVRGLLVQGFDDGYRRFSFHGFEQYVSLQLLLSTPSVVLEPELLLQGFLGQPRLGGYQRPEDNSSRAECLVACADFLNRRDFRLLQQGLDLTSLRRGLVRNANHYLETFSGYQGYARSIIASNAAYLDS